ncbi:hypothetical protein SAMN04488104_102311 [Algoriphagus faecimaris]|uniref:Uncharacterized protein n=1 Tax=Algoriphagus faecimaris TaxID=686796 RepID=A0A1G6TNX4_9BACT|nr:hypothetical protein SAMN04488104_102311 [Algoriphagus faecimaris]
MLNTDLFLASIISKIVDGLNGEYLNARSKTYEQVIRWLRVENKIQLKSISLRSVDNGNEAYTRAAMLSD